MSDWVTECAQRSLDTLPVAMALSVAVKKKKRRDLRRDTPYRFSIHYSSVMLVAPDPSDT
jgi:hypothetical protein